MAWGLHWTFRKQYPTHQPPQEARMRKLAPVFVLTSIVALTSGSALALGDRNKEKKSPNADTTATQSSTYGSPSSSSPSRSTSSGMSGSSSTTSSAGTGMTSSTGNGSSLGSSGATTAGTTHGATVSDTARDKPTEGSTVSGVAKSNKEACKGLAKSDPAYAANECDKLDKGAKRDSSSGSGK
jgi:hypothetical protein